jgi:hypothetical protein
MPKSVKIVVFWDAAPCSLIEILTDVPEVLTGDSTSETSVNFCQFKWRNNSS